MKIIYHKSSNAFSVAEHIYNHICDSFDAFLTDYPQYRDNYILRCVIILYVMQYNINHVSWRDLDHFTSKHTDNYIRHLMTSVCSPLLYKDRTVKVDKNKKFRTYIPQCITYKIKQEVVDQPGNGKFVTIRLKNDSFKRYYNKYKRFMHTENTHTIDNQDIAMNNNNTLNEMNEQTTPEVISEAVQTNNTDNTNTPDNIITSEPLPGFVEGLLHYYQRLGSISYGINSQLKETKYTFTKNRLYTPFHQLDKRYRDMLIDSETGCSLNEAIDLHAAYSQFLAVYAAKCLGGTDEVMTFYRRATSGEFYEDIMGMAASHDSTALTRDDVKIAVNSLYCANDDNFSKSTAFTCVYRYFKRYFPNILRLIESERGNLMTNLAGIELNVVSRTAYDINKELEAKQLAGMAVSLHDALFVTSNLAQYGYTDKYLEKMLMDRIELLFNKYTNPLF